MAISKWTEESVLRLSAPADKDVWHADPLVPGHGIRCRGSGPGMYGLRFSETTKDEHGHSRAKDRRLTNVRVGTATLASSRIWAQERWGEINRGEDPIAAKAKRAERQRTTLGNLTPAYLNHLEDAGREQNYIREVNRTLTAHFATLRDIPVSDIDKASTVRVLNAVRQNTSAATMRNARAHFSAFCSWCIEQDEMTINPTNGTTRVPIAQRERVLTDDELRRIWLALDGMNADYRDICRLLVLLGLRRNEISDLRFSEIDFQGARIRLPKERTKTNRAFDVPLPSAALRILQERERIEDRDLVFGTGAGGYNGFSKSKKILDAKSGVTGWRLHDCRHGLATVLCDRYRVLPHVADAILGHVQGGMLGRYNHASYYDERRTALEIWQEHITALCL
jgi:integrase